MILQHIPDMPRLYSGVDRQGRGWTALHFPKAYGEFINAMNAHQRAKHLKGLMADLKRFSGGIYG